MTKAVIIVDKLPCFIPEREDRLIITAKEFVKNDLPAKLADRRTLKVINLCSHYDYLRRGYYCSLLADARGYRCLPTVSDLLHISWKRLYQNALDTLKGALEKAIQKTNISKGKRSLYIFFGRTDIAELESFARKVFDAFRLPAVEVVIDCEKTGWVVKEVLPMPLKSVERFQEAFLDALDRFTGSYWASASQNKQEKLWLAILHDPKEKFPPSNRKALQNFVTVGKKMGIYVELITRKDMASLLEFDALFIRETTAVNNHTYRFAQKAEEEGIPVMDDTLSILRCCNKVYLQELLRGKRVPTPESMFLYRDEPEGLKTAAEKLGLPLVLKIPDGSFSRGVHKAKDAEELKHYASELFKKSELVLAQKFVPTAYDWRIGVLGGEPLYACQYHMAPGHWQIVNHAASGEKDRTGLAPAVHLSEVPKEVLDIAVKAANAIGKGLYGVDIKATPDGIMVIEVNDNPSIDAGVEDALTGSALYEKILQHFDRMVNGEPTSVTPMPVASLAKC